MQAEPHARETLAKSRQTQQPTSAHDLLTWRLKVLKVKLYKHVPVLWKLHL